MHARAGSLTRKSGLLLVTAIVISMTGNASAQARRYRISWKHDGSAASSQAIRSELAIASSTNDAAPSTRDINKSLVSAVEAAVKATGAQTKMMEIKGLATVQSATNAAPIVVANVPEASAIAANLTEQELAELKKNNSVDVEPDPVYTIIPVPIDDRASASVSSASSDQFWHIDAIKAAKVWNKSKGQGIVVAVLDTGVNRNDLLPDPQIKVGTDFTTPGLPTGKYPFDDSRHGTSVAGCIIGQRGYGVAPSAEIVPLKVLRNGQGFNTDIVKAIYEAVRLKVDIINLSLGTPPSGMPPGARKDLREALGTARQGGILVVAAAGNYDARNPGQKPQPIAFPAADSDTIAVAATDIRDAWASDFSNVGSGGRNPDVAAPGSEVQVVLGTASGTSFATPITTGTLALLLASKKSGDTKAQAADKARSALFGACGPVLGGSDVRTGRGLIDAEKAYAAFDGIATRLPNDDLSSLDKRIQRIKSRIEYWKTKGYFPTAD